MSVRVATEPGEGDGEYVMSVGESWIDAEFCGVRQHKQRLLMSVLVERTQVQGVRVVASKRAPGERVVNMIYEFDDAAGVCEISYGARPPPAPSFLSAILTISYRSD